MHRTLLSLLLICQLTQAVVGQQNPKPQPSPPTQNPPPVQQPQNLDAQDVVKITTNLVQVDAVVTDKTGKRVTDLKPAEVELSEDGQVRTITNFAYVNIDSSSSRPVVRASNPNTRDTSTPPLVPRPVRPGQVRRTIALVVDDLGLSFESSVKVRKSLQKFLDEQLQPDDLVAIIRTSGGIGALQSFTTDRRQLYAAVEKVKWNLIGRGEVSSFMSTAGMLRKDNPRENVSTVDSIDADKHLQQMRRDMFTVGTLGALHYVIKGLQPLPGRKAIVLFSDGFKIGLGGFFENNQIPDILRELTDFANRAAVVIYTLDARGLETVGLTAGDSTSDFNSNQVALQLAERSNSLIDTQQGLGFLSALTGGLAIRNSNDLNLGIKKVLDDQQGYYLIGYRPDDATFATVDGKSKFHHISLKVKREGSYSVRTRNSFYGRINESTSPKLTPKQQLEDALTSPFTSSDIQLKLTSIFANNMAHGSLLQSFLHVSASDLTFTTEPDGSRTATFNIAAVTFGDNGKVLDEFGYPVSITVPASEFERINKDGFVYSLGIPIKKPGAYQLRMAIRDETTERIGSANAVR